jgi:hypothetical protein
VIPISKNCIEIRVACTAGGGLFWKKMTTVRVIFLVMIQIMIARSFPIQRQATTGRSAALCQFAVRSFSRTKLRNQEEGSSTDGWEIPSKTTDLFEEYRNENNVRDQVFSAISADGSVKVTTCTVRNLVNDFMIAHTMTATPADALGRSMVCALMMSNGMQAEQTVQLTFNGKMMHSGMQ